MPTIVYAVHGMGAGSADGSTRAAGDRWNDSLTEALMWVADTYGIGRPTILDPVPQVPPSGSADPKAVWVVPISYHSVFDDFRRGASSREDALRGLGGSLSDLQIQELRDSDIAWTNCLDVFLWWVDRAQARPQATSIILEAITKVDRLARQVPGASVRRILVSHSLGTAAATFALRHLATNPEWRAMGGFSAWLTLANVAPFLIKAESVYGPPLIPGLNGSIVEFMINVRNEMDPFPWLLPWRRWDTSNTPKAWKEQWKVAANSTVVQLETRGVAAPPTRKPELIQVHGFANYVMAPPVSGLLAGLMRGGAFTSQELDHLSPDAAWSKLPQLTCGTATALRELKEEVERFKDLPEPVEDALNESGWFQRLLRATDLLVSAAKKCQ